MRLRHTEQAKEWLRNFDYAEQIAAVTLLDGLVLVTHDEFQRHLQTVLNSIAESADAPVALYAAREWENGLEYFPPDSPNHRPNAVGKGSGVGSEGLLANLIRDASRANPAVLDHPSIEELREHRVKKLVVVDDIVGSGKRSISFVRWLSRNRSIRSWMSSGHIAFHIAAFAATPTGRARVGAVSGVASVQCERVARYGRAKWSARQLESVEALSKRYAPRTGWSGRPFGYEGAMTMFVFQHGCPNTAPPILWRRSKKWRPLFEGRPEFAFAPWPEPLDDEERLQQVLDSLGLKSLRELQWLQYLAPQARERFVVVASLGKRRFSIDVLSDIAEVSVEECEGLVRECKQFGWVDELHRITKSGLKELRRARSLNIVSDSSPVLTDAIYVPQSYRGG